MLGAEAAASSSKAKPERAGIKGPGKAAGGGHVHETVSLSARISRVHHEMGLGISASSNGREPQTMIAAAEAAEAEAVKAEAEAHWCWAGKWRCCACVYVRALQMCCCLCGHLKGWMPVQSYIGCRKALTAEDGT